MKRLLLAINAILVLAASATAQDLDNVVRIKGMVLSAKTDEPILSVKVRVIDVSEDVAMGHTDSAGRFSLTVRPGIYTITFVANSYNGCILEDVNCLTSIVLEPVRMDRLRGGIEDPAVYVPSQKMIDTGDPIPVMQKIEREGVKVEVR